MMQILLSNYRATKNSLVHQKFYCLYDAIGDSTNLSPLLANWEFSIRFDQTDVLKEKKKKKKKFHA